MITIIFHGKKSSKKKITKGTSEEKTERIGLKFTPKYKQELEKLIKKD
ncbi:hypothetical protein ACN9KI_03560 [Aliarcobacter butzleri]|nr:hypothetical protein [Aliarcobacter butzleri]NUW26957.1 hypothetical protein [Aliarcobacter butzleri]